MEAVIKVEHVDLWYEKGKPTEVQALKDIDISIKKGDYVAFFGPSGCGKTTMLYAISGIDKYQSGRMLINGKDMTGLSARDLAYFRQTDIGIVFQQFNLLPSLNVLQNVMLPMAFRGIPKKQREAEAMKLIERLNLAPYYKRYPFELSGGQQQRVAIARAIANDPPIIIADEPLGNLDSVNAKNVLAFLKELNTKDGRTIIMVTHEAWSLVDVRTIFYMKDGHIVGEDTIDEGDLAQSLSDRINKEIMPGDGGQGGDALSEEGAARVLAALFLPGFSYFEISRLQEILGERLSGKIGKEEMFFKLRQSYESGGLGLWKEIAKDVDMHMQSLIERKKSVAEIKSHLARSVSLPIRKETKEILDWVLETDTGTPLSVESKEALLQLISDKLREYLTKEEFIKLASSPLEKFGAGLASHRALSLCEKLEALTRSSDGIFNKPVSKGPAAKLEIMSH